MKQFSGLDILQIVGALASILGTYLTLDQRIAGPDIVVVALLVVGLILVLVPSSLARRGRLPKVGRDDMISTGTRLIQGTKHEVVLFGGDMSWAPDYEDAIRSIISSGKNARVIYPDNPSTKVDRNARLLQDAGAQLVPLPIDSGMRAILIDPQDPVDALLFIANRTLKKGAVKVDAGDKGTITNYIYVARVYDIKRDGPLLRAVISLYLVLFHLYKQ